MTGMPLLQFDENPCARIIILMARKFGNCLKSIAPVWAWRVAILKITRATKLLKFYSDSHSNLMAWKWWWHIEGPRWKVRTALTILMLRSLEKRFSLGRCCKNQECVLAHRNWQEKKVSGAMRGSDNSCFVRKSNAKTMKTLQSDVWLAFCAHQIS